MRVLGLKRYNYGHYLILRLTMTNAEIQKQYPGLKPFEAGHVNVGGRPKGAKNFATIIRNMVENDKYKVRLKDGTVIKRPGASIVHEMVGKAYNGDVQAATWLAKYGYGEKQDITSNGETISSSSPVTLQLSGDFTRYLLERTSAKDDVIVVPDTSTSQNGLEQATEQTE